MSEAVIPLLESSPVQSEELAGLGESFANYRLEAPGVRRPYPKALIRRATELVESGLNAATVASAIGVVQGQVAKWRRKQVGVRQRGGGFVEVKVKEKESERIYTLKSRSGFYVDGLSRSETIGLMTRLEAEARCL